MCGRDTVAEILEAGTRLLGIRTREILDLRRELRIVRELLADAASTGRRVGLLAHGATHVGVGRHSAAHGPAAATAGRGCRYAEAEQHQGRSCKHESRGLHEPSGDCCGNCRRHASDASVISGAILALLGLTGN